MVLGAVIGVVVGFWAGVYGWMVFYYFFFMDGTSWGAMDQGAMPVIFTGPAGAIIGAGVLGHLFQRWFGKKQDAES
jgi:hypothetical protein